MASATIVKPQPVEATVHLKITESEAKALLAVFDNVGGGPETGRGLVDNVARALRGTGLTTERRQTTGSVYFRELNGDVCASVRGCPGHEG